MTDPTHGVRVEIRDGFTVLDLPSEGRRGGDSLPFSDQPQLRAALSEAGFEVACELVVLPTAGSVERRGEETDRAPATAEVEVAADESAVVLIEGPGEVFAWRLPTTADGPGDQRRGARTLNFDLAAPRADAASGAERRGVVTDWLVDRLVEPVRAYVLRFAVGAIIKEVVARIEDKPVGRVVIGSNPTQWLPDPHAAPPAIGERPMRVLLMIHGTFSSTLGSFGGFTQHEDGREFLKQAAHQYDLVLGYDHPTLAESPEANAQAILDDLRALALPAGTRVDAVAYSRGGLVYRVLAEALLPGAGLGLTLGSAVFVGCTNAGTHLAEPKNWAAMVDLYTNVLLAGARALQAINPGSALAKPLIDQAIKTLGRFVQAFSDVAITDGHVPGLKAMQPEGDTVRALNTATDHGDTLARYHVISSDFRPSFEPGNGITRELAEFLIDRVTNRLFATQNDLVVDTASMTQFGTRRGQLGDHDRRDFGSGDSVYHLTYFLNPIVARQLTEWLFVQQVQDDQNETEEPPQQQQQQQQQQQEAQFEEADRRQWQQTEPSPRRSLDHFSPIAAPFAPDDRVTRRGDGEAEFGSPAVAAPDFAAAEPIDPDLEVECHFAADMDSMPQAEVLTPLHVTVARELLASANSATSQASGATRVKVTAPIRLRVLALRNCTLLPDAGVTLIGDDQAEADVLVPMTDRPNGQRFLLKGTAAGPAEIQVEARQLSRVLASFTLKPIFVAAVQDRLKLTQPAAVPAAPSSEQPVVLRIYESYRDGQVRLKFNLDCEDNPNLAEPGFVDLPPNFKVDEFVGGMLREFEDAWRLGASAYDLKLKRFIASSVRRADQLIPERIRKSLWLHRDAIRAVQVISEESRIPWELLYLADPSGAISDERGFLSEWGLVRWLPGARWPGRTLKLGSNARTVIPVYKDSRQVLKGAAAEHAMLARLLPGATELAASVESVTEFLRNAAKDCGLLHFACHGDAQMGNSLQSDLMMQGIDDEAGTIIREPLSSDMVSYDATFGAGAPSALVFVNACRTGQTAAGISGADGFASAFLRPRSEQGAGAFIGALWQVDDQLALGFADAFYDAMLNQEATLVDAVRAGREASKKNKDFTWLAYSIYGNPFARAG